MKIYYNEVMKFFGDEFVKRFDFERVSREEALKEEEVFWFGIYDLDDYEAIIKSENQVYLHWCGSDAPWCIQNKFIEKLAEKKNIFHSADSVQIRKELSPFIPSERIVFAPLYSHGVEFIKPKGLKKFKKGTHVVVYQPGRDVYCPDMMIQLAKETPEYTYHWVGDANGAFKNLPENIRNHGYMKHNALMDLIERSHALVRYTLHDGFANMIIEAGLLGTGIVSNQDIPLAYKADTVDNIKKGIQYARTGRFTKTTQWWYKNGDMINNWDRVFHRKVYPTVDIVIVDSGRNEAWFKQAIVSAQKQVYPYCDILVINNKDKKLGVGEAYNKAAQESKADYVFYLGDDDYISSDVILNLVEAIISSEEQMMGVVNSTLHVTYVDEKGVMKAQGANIPTGMWLRKWLLDYPFNENLKKLVDTELIERAQQESFIILTIPYHYGYFYRQHDKMVSGNKLKQREEANNESRTKKTDA